MKWFAAVACGALVLTGCGGSGPAPASPGAAEGPLTATFGGRPFQPRGILGKREDNGVHIFIYDRAAACGTPSESFLAGERYFQIVLREWPVAANGTPIDAHAPSIGVNAQKREGSGGSGSSLDGTLRFMSSTPAGGTIIIHARNKDGSLDGELPFAICN